MTVNEDKTLKEIDRLFDHIDKTIESFKEVKDRLSKIEIVLDGKGTEGKESLYYTVHELRKKVMEIEEKIEEEIIEEIETIQEQIKNFATASIVKEDKFTHKLNNVDTLEKDLQSVNDRVSSLELYKEGKESVSKFITWIIPGVALLVTIVNLYLVITGKK